MTDASSVSPSSEQIEEFSTCKILGVKEVYYGICASRELWVVCCLYRKVELRYCMVHGNVKNQQNKLVE